MAWGGTSDPVKFVEALKWFAARAVFTKDDWRLLAAAAQQRSFTVSGVAQLDVLVEVQESLSAAIDAGMDFADWRKEIGQTLEAAWEGTVANPGHRLDTIYRNALHSSFNSGRYVQQTRPATLVARPFWVFDAVLDLSTSAICESRAGTTKPADDPWWDGNTPPLHHRCFPPGTLVTTRDGRRPIETVREGDHVLTHRGRYRPVVERMASPSPETLCEVRLSSSRTLRATPNHPALTDRGWVELAALRPGDHVFHIVETVGQDRSVGQDQGRVPASDERAEPIGGNALPHLGHFDQDARVRETEVGEVQLTVEDERVVEHEAPTDGRQEVREPLLNVGHAHMTVRVPTRVLSEDAAAAARGLAHDGRTLEPLALSELPAVLGEAGMRVLGVALRPVLSPGGSFEVVAPELLAGGSPTLGGAFPLRADGFAAPADRDAVAFEERAERLVAPDPEDRHHLPVGEAAVYVQFAEVGGQVLAVLSAEPVLDGGMSLGHDESYRIITAAVVHSVRSVPAAAPIVFNLSIAGDESYVADDVIVHNCRSSIRTVRKSVGEERIRDGWDRTDNAEAVRGSWGRKPEPLDHWEPRESDYPPALWNAYMEARTPTSDGLPSRVSEPLEEIISQTDA